MPVGAITILILETGLSRGFWSGFAAASGAATADLIYASIAATLGSVIAIFLEPFALVLKWASAIFLIGLGLWGLARGARRQHQKEDQLSTPRPTNIARTYATLLLLTLLNPATIAYFAALILGLNIGSRFPEGGKIVFVLGAFFASWSWQTILAIIGSLAHKHLTPNFRYATNLLGNFIVIGFGFRILI